MSQRDVAQRAGVSSRTVSNVLNDFPHVRTEVRERVRQAMADLGYRPNRAAQSFRTGKSGIITLAIPELAVEYFAELAHLVEIHAADAGYTVLVSQTSGDVDAETAALDGFDRHVADGLLFSPVALDADRVLERTDRAPVVVIGEQLGVQNVDHVGIDNVEAARLATAHLLESGRKAPLFLGVPRGLPTFMADLRLSGFRAALHDAGHQWSEERIGPPVEGFYRRSGYLAVIELLERFSPPAFDSLICANDLVAQGAMRALHERAWRVPNDVAVIGFDDIEESSFSRPSLSSIAQDKNAIARESVRLLARRISGDTSPPVSVVTPFALRMRESTHPTTSSADEQDVGITSA